MLIEPPTSSRRALVTGLPLSRASISANSSACFSRRSPSPHTSLERSAGEMRDHGPVSSAFRAAITARIDVRFISGRDVGDDFLRRRIFDLEGLAALRLDPFAVDQHVMLLGQKRLRIFAKLRFGDGDVHDILPDGAAEI